MNYIELLEHSYNYEKEFGMCQPEDRLCYLSEYIFNFTTYDSSIDVLFATKAVDVCNAITERKTVEYINDEENYKWFLIMCNMPFFSNKIEWGGSIRGAWWIVGETIEFESCGLWVGDKQITETIRFSSEQWGEFAKAIVCFSQRAF